MIPNNPSTSAESSSLDGHSVRNSSSLLPQEVLETIVRFLQAQLAPAPRQKILHSCCLVSQQWYSVCVQHLYYAPVITGRNYSLLTRTLCPPVNARIRRVGLEEFVHHIDMGRLAYESKRSTTARLIGRVKGSLTTFVAPAISFSTTALAPLSKCAKLERLDLSRDTYDFRMSQLMHALANLEQLSELVLPRETWRTDLIVCSRLMRERTQSFWPPSLSYLQFNETSLEPSSSQWRSLLISLPPSLQTLVFANCQTYRTFEHILEADALVQHVTNLVVDVRRGDDAFMMNHLTRPFPHLKELTIPAMTSWALEDPIMLVHLLGSNTNIDPFSDDWTKSRGPDQLERLILQASPDFVSSAHINVAQLIRFVERCPSLLRIDVPEAYLDLDTFEFEDIDGVNDVLENRARARNGGDSSIGTEDVGIFLTAVTESKGPGLKRSLRYSV